MPVLFKNRVAKYYGIEDKRLSATAVNIGIGTTSPNDSLTVNGSVSIADTLLVSGRLDCDTLYVGSLGVNVPDYVFEPGYELRELEQVERFIEQYKHLPGIPSANDREGWRRMSLTAFNKKLLEKIEEQMLYIFKLKTENKAQNERIERQDERIDRLERLIQGRR